MLPPIQLPMELPMVIVMEIGNLSSRNIRETLLMFILTRFFLKKFKLKVQGLFFLEIFPGFFSISSGLLFGLFLIFGYFLQIIFSNYFSQIFFRISDYYSILFLFINFFRIKFFLDIFPEQFFRFIFTQIFPG